MTYDPQAKAKALRARINTEKPTSQTLEMILAEALKEAWEAAQVPGRLNSKQQEQAINLLHYVADGCWCKPSIPKCGACIARDLFKELGYVLDKNGHWSLPKPV